MKTIILDSIRIERILQRIAFEILENCHSLERVTLIGILPRGEWVANSINENLSKTSNLKVDLLTLDISKLDELKLHQDLIAGGTVLLVDDVIKSGQTMMEAAAAIMQFMPKQLITISLVDRKHRRFPIHSDLTGLSLATTMQEHIHLEISPKPMVYLE
jgi:pyrimidine operon attenuation protein/uracil phosphoribosyltransferase